MPWTIFSSGGAAQRRYTELAWTALPQESRRKRFIPSCAGSRQSVPRQRPPRRAAARWARDDRHGSGDQDAGADGLTAPTPSHRGTPRAKATVTPLAVPNPASPGCLSCPTVAPSSFEVSVPPIALMSRPPRSVPPGPPPATWNPRPRGARRAQARRPGARRGARRYAARLWYRHRGGAAAWSARASPPAAPLAAAPPPRRFRLLRWACRDDLGTLALGLVLLWFRRADLPRPDSALDATPGQPDPRRPQRHVFASFGDVVGEPLRLGDYPPYLPAAVVAVEDRRFWHHAHRPDRHGTRRADDLVAGQRGAGGRR